MLGDIPFNAFARAISAARISLNLTRRPHATVPGSSTARPFELASSGAAIVSNPHEGIERWFEPGRELVVVESAEEAVAAYRELVADPAQAEEMGRRARERVLDEHTYAHRARRLLELVGLEAGVDCMSFIAVVPAWNEEGAIGRVVDEIRAFDAAATVVVVDDASVDGTADVAEAHGATVLRLPFNVGIGGAVQTGFRYARDEGYEVGGETGRRRPARRVGARKTARADPTPGRPIS